MRSPTVLLAFLISLSALAAEKTSGDLSYTHYWYEGDTRRPIAVDPDLIGEVQLNANRAARSSRGVTHAPIKIIKRSILQARTSDVVPTTPVFRDSRSKLASMRALPGHVIVHFPQDWSSEKILDWSRQQRIAIGERLNVGANTYLILAGAGLSSLELANRLYETGDVVAAYPNWWQQTSKR